jgi:hypothetical protein
MDGANVIGDGEGRGIKAKAKIPFGEEQGSQDRPSKGRFQPPEYRNSQEKNRTDAQELYG